MLNSKSYVSVFAVANTEKQPKWPSLDELASLYSNGPVDQRAISPAGHLTSGPPDYRRAGQLVGGPIDQTPISQRRKPDNATPAARFSHADHWCATRILPLAAPKNLFHKATDFFFNQLLRTLMENSILFPCISKNINF